MRSTTASPRQSRISFATYIVRIYQFEKNKPQRLLGVVEEVGTRKKSAFAGHDELWAILSSPKAAGIKSGKGNKRNKNI